MTLNFDKKITFFALIRPGDKVVKCVVLSDIHHYEIIIIDIANILSSKLPFYKQ